MSTESDETTALPVHPASEEKPTVSPATATAPAKSPYASLIKKILILIIVLAIGFAVYKFVIQKKLLSAAKTATEEKVLTKMVSVRGSTRVGEKPPVEVTMSPAN